MGKEIKGLLKGVGDITENSLGFHGIRKAIDPLDISRAGGDGGAGEQQPKKMGMPTPDDEAVRAARRRKAAQMQQRGGRESTILTQASERLGG